MIHAALATNPLRTRAEVQAALLTLFDPLRSHFSPGGARVRIGVTGAHFDDTAAELEGFARPLWGLVPLEAGGGTFDGWNLIRRGLANGVDPQHPEHWGAAVDRDQRLVEMSAIGFGLALLPDQLWEPLSQIEQANLIRWLDQINQRTVADSNWHFFRVLANLGLQRVGAPFDREALQASLDQIDEFYLGDGWYTDGPHACWQRDYYVPFAIHFFGLIYARLMDHIDLDRAARYRERAAAFTPDFLAWFAADGSALPFGRSLCYRFAQGAFWGALAFADVEALPWGVLKGLWLRHGRWWLRQPIFNNDGTLSIGYGYPNLNMAEDYNSPQSVYWAFKYFLPLALPDNHPFWQAEEAPLPVQPVIRSEPHPGMIMCRDAESRHVWALSSGQRAAWARHGEAKYSKFAYSTAFGFSVPAGQRGLIEGAYDSTLALSDDGSYYRTRVAPLDARLHGSTLYSRWQPWPDVEIETWLIADPPWHLRVHRIRTSRALWSAEGGWAVDRTGVVLQIAADTGRALAVYERGWSGLRDLGGARRGTVINPVPNTNLIHPRTALPMLLGEHAPGEHWLVCAVVGEPWIEDWGTIWNAPPPMPQIPIS